MEKYFCITSLKSLVETLKKIPPDIINKKDYINELIKKEESVSLKEEIAPPLRGIYICQPNKAPTIGLASSLDSIAERRSIMAEELGHHFTTGSYCLCREFYNYSVRQNIDKVEYKALRWAANYLISDDELLDAFYEGIDDARSLAERFSVMPEIIRLRIKLFEKPVY